MRKQARLGRRDSGRRFLATASAGLVAVVFAGLPVATAAQQPVPIFNGVDLEGWTVHGTERWYVEDGELVCESGPEAAYGYLRTDAEYRDFELTLEFKQEADGNSGVFFRSTLDGVVITGWQAEVAPPGLFTGGIYESYGRGWLIQPEAEKDAALRMGEWNEMRIRVDGDRVTTWLNGTEMIDLTDEKIGGATGHIALQIHDGAASRCAGATSASRSSSRPPTRPRGPAPADYGLDTGRPGQSPRWTITSPSLTTISTSCTVPMSMSGLCSSTIRSASKPGAIRPVSSSTPNSSAAVVVAAWSASSGVSPTVVSSSSS